MGESVNVNAFTSLVDLKEAQAQKSHNCPFGRSTSLHYHSKVWGQQTFFLKKNNTFIQQGHIKLIKVTVKTFIMLQKVSFKNFSEKMYYDYEIIK